MNIGITFLSLLWVFVAHTAVISDPDKYEQDLKQKIADLKQIEAKDYIQKTELLKNEILDYIDYKKGLCLGDFTSLAKNIENLEAGASSPKKSYKDKRLEQKKCFDELKASHLLFIENLYFVKKKYLKFVFDNNLSDITKNQVDDLSKIQKIYNQM